MDGEPLAPSAATQLRVLGPLEVVLDGHPVAVRRGRPRRLLLALLVRWGRAVTTDTLIDDLWGEDSPRNSANALQILISYLRKLLVDGHGPRIETVDNGYRLVVEPEHVDALLFEHAVRALPEVEDPGERLRRADHALSLWRGEPLAEATYDSFAQAEIRRLRELRVAALDARIQGLLDLGRHVEAVGELLALVAEHPLHERFYAQLMLALYRSGRQAEAMRAYEAVRSTLLDELGLDPGPELQALVRAVLSQAPTLDWTPPIAAPPVRTASPAGTDAPGVALTTTTDLPVGAGALIGREDDVARLGELLGERRLVTLTGPGGAGKTRLALEVVRAAAASGTPVWWADLAGTSGEEDVLSAVATATGATNQPTDTGAGIVGQLGARSGILVLDTCEHVIAGVRRLVGRVVSECPAVTVLVTSRQSLRLMEELAWPVPPLSLPSPDATAVEQASASAAVLLFVDRASQARPGFELTAHNAADVARIALLLDGLPLAIELAAVHADTLSPRQLVELLVDRLRVLVDDQRTDRQHALRATIAWSYELLDADEAMFFERLSVFTGSFPLEAAVTVAGDGLERDGFEVLLALTRQSLVVAGDDDRFRLLDTVRAFASERLQGGAGVESLATRSRHARWYADLALEGDRHLRGPDATGWLLELRVELANLRAALEWSFQGGEAGVGARLAAALSWFWAIEGQFGEAARWLGAARGVVSPGTVLEADVLASAAIHAASLGDLALAAEQCGLACKLYDEHGGTGPLARALVFLGIAQWGLGDPEAAATHDRAIALFSSLGDEWGKGLALVLRARTAADQGNDHHAERLLDRALPAVRRGGDPHIVALCLEQRARVATRAGDVDLGVMLAAESVKLDEAIGYIEGVVAGLNALGLAVASRGDLETARGHHARALRLAVQLDHPGGMTEALEALASLSAGGGDPMGAARLLGAAEALRERAELPRLRSHQEVVAAALLAAADLDDDARRSAATAGRLLDLSRLAEELTAHPA